MHYPPHAGPTQPHRLIRDLARSTALFIAATAPISAQPTLAQSSFPVPLLSEVYYNAPPMGQEVSDRLKASESLSTEFQSVSSQLSQSQACAQTPHPLLTPLQQGGLTHAASPILFIQQPLAEALIDGSVMDGSVLAKAGTAASLLLWREGNSASPTQIPATPSPVSGYLKLDLAAAEIELEPDTVYFWQRAACRGIEEPATASGWIQRVELPEAFSQVLETASLEQKAILYSQYGLWYDAVGAAMALAATQDFEPLEQLQLQSPTRTNGAQ